MKKQLIPRAGQPRPRTPGLTRRTVREHAARLFPDVLLKRPLTMREWLLAEQDLACKLEHDGL